MVGAMDDGNSFGTGVSCDKSGLIDAVDTPIISELETFWASITLI